MGTSAYLDEIATQGTQVKKVDICQVGPPLVSQTGEYPGGSSDTAQQYSDEDEEDEDYLPTESDEDEDEDEDESEQYSFSIGLPKLIFFVFMVFLVYSLLENEHFGLFIDMYYVLIRQSYFCTSIRGLLIIK